MSCHDALLFFSNSINLMQETRCMTTHTCILSSSFLIYLSLVCSANALCPSWSLTLPCCLPPHSPSMCAVNNWWSVSKGNRSQRNVSPISLFIYQSIFKHCPFEKPLRFFTGVAGIDWLIPAQQWPSSSSAAAAAPMTMSGLTPPV